MTEKPEPEDEDNKLEDQDNKLEDQDNKPEDDGSKPEDEDNGKPVRSSDDAAQDAGEPEVVAHFDDGGKLPWCIGCIG